MATMYDKAMTHVDYYQWTNFLLNVIQKEHINTNKIVDLGCGTGEITIQLAKQGFQMIGVDMSADMLSIATEKSFAENVNVTWLQQDIRQLSGFFNVELFVSFFDVINYITNEEELKDTFKTIYHSLSIDGYFIFDVHHIDYVNERLIGHSFSDVADDFAYIWDCIKGNHDGHMIHQMTFFIKSKNQYYEKYTESHDQRTWELAQYEAMLKTSGFSKIDFYGDFKTENSIIRNQHDRIFIVAKK